MASDKQDKVLNVPTLRFPKFSGEWVRDNIFNVAPLQRGFDLPTQDIEDGEYPVVYSNGILRTHKYYKCEAPGLVTGRSGSIGNFTFIPEGNYWPHNTSLWVTNFHGNDPLFIYYLYQTINISQYATGSGVPTLNRNDVHRHGVSIPLVPEQRKIAEFLSLIDKRIVTQNRIIEDLRNLKTYIHNRVFSKVNTLFGQRNTIRLSDIATKITRKNKGNTINNVLSNSAAMGIVPQAEVFDKEIANEDNTANYYVIENGDFVYNPRKSAQAPFGPINMYKGQAKGIISPLYLCFQVTDINKNYLLHYFMSNVWYSYIYSNGDTGVRHDRVSIKDETFLNMPLYIHTVDKQQEIAKMMDQVDAKIALEELYLTKLQKQKDYLLAAMFV